MQIVISRDQATMGRRTFDQQRALEMARQTIQTEADCLQDICADIDIEFSNAVEAMFHCAGRVIVIGMGKSGHIGRKIAATLASTGTPAFFVHPAEAGHGDLGMITPTDVVLAISNSGEADEIIQIIPSIKRMGAVLIAITGQRKSILAKSADIVISNAISREACPLNLAPTSSTTAQLAIGDALAVALLDAKGFNEIDFARSHPSGSLGRQLLTRTSDLMRKGIELPIVYQDTSLIEVMREMNKKEMGIAIMIADQTKLLLGIFTDGDLRRCIESGADIRSLCAVDVFNRNPQTIRPMSLAREAVDLMRRESISTVLICDEKNFVLGAITAGDLMRAKIH